MRTRKPQDAVSIASYGPQARHITADLISLGGAADRHSPISICRDIDQDGCGGPAGDRRTGNVLAPSFGCTISSISLAASGAGAIPASAYDSISHTAADLIVAIG